MMWLRLVTYGSQPLASQVRLVFRAVPPTVQPLGIGNEPNVLFDVSRQKQVRVWNVSGATVKKRRHDNFPNIPGQPDLANDSTRYTAPNQRKRICSNMARRPVLQRQRFYT